MDCCQSLKTYGGLDGAQSSLGPILSILWARFDPLPIREALRGSGGGKRASVPSLSTSWTRFGAGRWGGEVAASAFGALLQGADSGRRARRLSLPVSRAHAVCSTRRKFKSFAAGLRATQVRSHSQASHHLPNPLS